MSVRLALAAILASVVCVGAQQPPTFRAAVDLIAVDVQVVDGKGQPIEILDRDNFQVTIDGKKRRVTSANLVQHTSADDGRLNGLPPPAGGASALTADGAGRTFILAIDAGSFSPGEAMPVLDAARDFVRKLPAGDRVGLFTMPRFGPNVNPTVDHSAVKSAIDRLAGQRQSLAGQFHLSVSEIIDISSETAGLGAPTMAITNPAGTRGAPAFVATDLSTLQRVQQRECRSATDFGCHEAIVSEAAALSKHLEERVLQSLDGLNGLLQLLREFPGRKTVVVLSAGMAVSDRPGARLDIGTEATQLGEQAAHANATIYALHIELGMRRAYSAEARRAPGAGSLDREQRLSERMLDEFSGASGGALLSVLVGSGERALDRVLRETSSFYLLGVEPANMDRDGRTHRLNVKVNQRGATVRSRQWVVLQRK